jgi:hypothetical protein
MDANSRAASDRAGRRARAAFGADSASVGANTGANTGRATRVREAAGVAVSREACSDGDNDGVGSDNEA